MKILFSKITKYRRLLLCCLVGMLLCNFVSCGKDELSKDIVCDILPSGDEGKPIALSVKFGGIASFEEITRSQHSSKPLVTPLGDGLRMEASVEADPQTATRATAPIEGGTRCRVVAVKSCDYSYVSHGDFIIGEPSATAFTVPSGETYDFICVSYHSTVDLPDFAIPPTVGEAPSFAVTPENDRDLLYARIEGRTVNGASDAELNFTGANALKHRFTRVNVVIDCTYNGWDILSVAANSIPLPLSYAATMDCRGALAKSGSALAEEYFSWRTRGTEANMDTLSSARLIFTGDTEDVYSFTLPVSGLTIKDKFRNFDYPTPCRLSSVSFGKLNLMPGLSYVLRLRLKTPAYASSNIYWDGAKLTFDDIPRCAGDDADDSALTQSQKKQGVFFKWGSLVGIAPSCTGSFMYASPVFSAGTAGSPSTGTPLYIPDGSGGWIQTNAASLSVNDPDGNPCTPDWNGIPFANPAGAVADRESTYLYDMPEENYALYMGDICKYLTQTGAAPPGNWRMPRSIDFGPSTDDSSWGGTELRDGWRRVGDSQWLVYSNIQQYDYPNGQYTGLVNGGVFGPSAWFFPAAGFRNTNGRLELTGVDGRYWSASVGSGDGASLLNITGDYLDVDHDDNRKTGSTVRCVRK
ncbi:MAG: hypothetical protein LBR48_01810 [Dysgonamonadaceae bacterium]|nr:hypothetical protein [Dysgonamonadaceae bacterium]